MQIRSTVYLPFSNDITSGGRVFKVSMKRVGKMLGGKKDSSFREVYSNNKDSFAYPKIEVSIICRKGHSYITSLDVNATS